MNQRNKNVYPDCFTVVTLSTNKHADCPCNPTDCGRIQPEYRFPPLYGLPLCPACRCEEPHLALKRTHTPATLYDRPRVEERETESCPLYLAGGYTPLPKGLCPEMSQRQKNTKNIQAETGSLYKNTPPHTSSGS